MTRRSGYRKDNRLQGPRGRRVVVKENTMLLSFLFDLLKEQSKSSVKALLGHGQISINGKVTTQFDAPLSPNDIVNISYERGRVAFSHPLLKIIWEDDDLIVVEKKAGLLSVADIKARERSVHSLLSNYMRKVDPRNKIFVLQRLGREASGLMLLAKNKDIQDKLQNNWARIVQDYVFAAVVEGHPKKDADLITTDMLIGNSSMRQYVTREGDGGGTVTRYKVLRSNKEYSLLEIRLELGRRNQIREQMLQMGLPIAGDMKSGAKTNPENRLMLQAYKLRFIHPVTGEGLTFNTRIPTTFLSITK